MQLAAPNDTERSKTVWPLGGPRGRPVPASQWTNDVANARRTDGRRGSSRETEIASSGAWPRQRPTRG